MHQNESGKARYNKPQEKNRVPFLVQITTALGRTAEARDLILLEWEMVVCETLLDTRIPDIERTRRTIGNLVPIINILLRVNNNLLLSINCDDLCSAVWITRMVDQPAGRNIGQCKAMVSFLGLTQDCPSSSHPPPTPRRYGINSYYRYLAAHTPSPASPQLEHESPLRHTR